MILPYASGPATQWQLFDYGQKFVTAAGKSTGGQAIATVGTVPTDEFWMLDLIRVKSVDTDLTSRAFICLNDPAYDVSGTATGAYDVADQSSPIHAPPGTVILIVWQQIPDGLQPSCYAQWTVLKSTQMGGV